MFCIQSHPSVIGGVVDFDMVGSQQSGKLDAYDTVLFLFFRRIILLHIGRMGFVHIFGCVAGPGTILPVDKAAKFVEKYAKEATTASPKESPFRHVGEKLD